MRSSRTKPGAAQCGLTASRKAEILAIDSRNKFNGEGGFTCIYSSDQHWLLSWLSPSFSFAIILFLPANGNCFLLLLVPGGEVRLRPGLILFWSARSSDCPVFGVEADAAAKLLIREIGFCGRVKTPFSRKFRFLFSGPARCYLEVYPEFAAAIYVENPVFRLVLSVVKLKGRRGVIEWGSRGGIF